MKSFGTHFWESEASKGSVRLTFLISRGFVGKSFVAQHGSFSFVFHFNYKTECAYFENISKEVS